MTEPGRYQAPLDMSSSDAGQPNGASKKKPRSNRDPATIKRRCVSTACIACRRRKSKCDGNTPSCAACSSVYGTECIYDPGSDHRRKGVYKDKTENLKARETTLQTIIQAILNYNEEDVPALVRQIRTCSNLDDVAESITRKEQEIKKEDLEDEVDELNAPQYAEPDTPSFEHEISGKMGELRLENGAIRFIGGTSNLIYLTPEDDDYHETQAEGVQQSADPILSWTNVTKDKEIILHLLNMYLSWHYPYFTTLSRSLFIQDFGLGKPSVPPKRTMYCSSLLVNAMLALGCHFTNSPAGCADPNDPSTKGDAFFAEAKRLIVENDEYEKPRLTTIQALALMSVREAGCGREAKGWVYSGMSFRMALDLGLNLDSDGMTTAGSKDAMDEREKDARRVTFWGCFLFDKCWSNYLGRLPQLPASNITVPKFDVFPEEDAEIWSPYTDTGVSTVHAQPSRTRAVALQTSKLCEISGDLLSFFYHPTGLEKPVGKGTELKRLGDLHTRLEGWRKDLSKEFEPKEGQLPHVLLMHMFYHLLYIHLFRPFLKYSPATSPLPAHVSPRKLCTAAASAISKLMRLYKRTYGLRQICNIAVYIVHSACTIHLLNLPTGSQTLNVTNAGKVPVGETVGKAARRDIVHGVKHLEEIAEDWLCARRTLSIISVLARKWKINLPEDAQLVLERTDHKYGTFSTKDVPSPVSVGKAPSLDGSTRSSPSPYTYLCPATNQQMPNPGDMTSMAEVLSSHPVSTIEVDSYGAQASTSWQPPPNPNIHPFTPYNTIPYTSAPSTPHGVAFNNHQFTQPQATPQQQQQLRQYLAYANPTTTKPTPMTNTVPSSILPRQLSPSTIFGQAEALAESNSQDWWLRDQAALAVGFENWGAGTPDMEVVDQGQGGLMMPTYFMPGDGSQGSQRGNGGVRMGGGLTAGLAASNSGSSPGSGMGGPGGGEWYG